MGEDNNNKSVLRADLLRVRAALTAEQQAVAERAIAERALELEELAGARTVAAYVSIGSEPGTRALLEVLRGRREHVLLPVLLGDNDLDWAVYGGPEGLERSARGLYQPAGPRLGVDAVTEADVVLLPGLAVDGRGMRLGRGGGSYDRVLGRLEAAGAGAALMMLLYGHEVLGRVPAEAHDRPVDAVVTPEGVTRFPRGGGSG
jgi:5-formyltetrahydrofolate cyclo-ligase